MVNFSNCKYYRIDYTLKRRRAKKFCSASCRSFNHRDKKRLEKNTNLTVKSNEFKNALKIDKMSLTGEGNALVGKAALEIAKEFLTPKKIKLLKKGDLEELIFNLKGGIF